MTTLLDLVGVIALCAFAFAVWPPLTLLIVALACLVASANRSAK